MNAELVTKAELNAKQAESLRAFSGLNLLHIKRQVESLLGLIGRGQIFDQYTKHDISHINEMLNMLDWIIPESTKVLMSATDWLMIVLAVYFHDMGLLVTDAEYNARTTSGLSAFCENVLFAGVDGKDYQTKIESLEGSTKEKFLYQEFVRHKHAERIRYWIMGQTNEQLGVAKEVSREVDKLLEPLGSQFRRDLGIVCESHHLNDLYDIKKYKVSQPYGQSDNELANLQYCAVLLRTADLLHITSDRTPSIEFRTINPTDPISQQEWAKQMAVKKVASKWGVNEEGKPDERAPRDTIDIHAYFTKEDGYFGLTSYLAYANDQIKKSYEWIATTAKTRLAKHEFPWRRIDDSDIETEGFIKQAFEFTIDQTKILDLLTGHTLYNDINVVLRELVQNAIDAVRLSYYPSSPVQDGLVRITWQSNERILTVQDNGTGMSQAIINNFLLKVGSSRYQDPEFKKTYPEFNSISRFGIGVLSAFMIADSVEILTCHPEEDQARRLMLRSVHGKYLISLLNKNAVELQSICPHGTIFRLHVRPSVDMPDVCKTSKHWIVVPECKVELQINNNEPLRIGFDTIGEALKDYLKYYNVNYTEDETEYNSNLKTHFMRIVEKEKDGVKLAYATVWDRQFKEWLFLSADWIRPNRLNEDDDDGSILPLGICLEGIRITSDTPGFDSQTIVAMANVRGSRAPKTNVARSGLEYTPERDVMLKSIYTLYADHITSEISSLKEHRHFSLTWATREAYYLLKSLINGMHNRFRPLNTKLLTESLEGIPLIIVEQDSKRLAMSPRELAETDEVWTIDCNLLAFAEELLKETPSNVSLAGILKAINVKPFLFPKATVVCGSQRIIGVDSQPFDSKEVDRIVVNHELRRVDLRWVRINNPPRWLQLPEDVIESASRFIAGRGQSHYGSLNFPLVPNYGVEVEVNSGEIAVKAFGFFYLLPGTELALFARNLLETVKVDFSNKSILAAVAMLYAIQHYLVLDSGPVSVDLLRNLVRVWDGFGALRHADYRIEDCFDFNQFAAIMVGTKLKLFNSLAWKRDEDDDSY